LHPEDADVRRDISDPPSSLATLIGTRSIYSVVPAESGTTVVMGYP
jgi:hypothetical protein